MRTDMRAAWFALLTAVLGAARPADAGPPEEVLPPAPVPVAPAPPAPLPPAEPPCPPACEPAGEPGAFLLGADYLLMKPRRMPLDFAIVGPSGPFGPLGDVRSLDYDISSGFRAGGGYRLPGEGCEVAFFYTFLHSTGSAGAAAPPDGSLFPTLNHPGLVELADTASADAGLDYHVFDLEFGKRFQPGEAWGARAFAGPRFAHVVQDFHAFYDGGDASQDNVTSRVAFDGGGVRAGGEATWSVYRGVGLYARGGASLLAGSFRTSLAETLNGGATPVVNVTDSFHKVVPVFEMGMGLSWQYGGWRLTAGYEFVDWVGLVDGIDFVDDVHAGKPARRTGDLSLDGLVLRAELGF